MQIPGGTLGLSLLVNDSNRGHLCGPAHPCTICSRSQRAEDGNVGGHLPLPLIPSCCPPPSTMCVFLLIFSPLSSYLIPLCPALQHHISSHLRPLKPLTRLWCLSSAAANLFTTKSGNPAHQNSGWQKRDSSPAPSSWVKFETHSLFQQLQQDPLTQSSDFSKQK